MLNPVPLGTKAVVIDISSIGLDRSSHSSKTLLTAWVDFFFLFVKLLINIKEFTRSDERHGVVAGQQVADYWEIEYAIIYLVMIIFLNGRHTQPYQNLFYISLLTIFFY